MKPTVLLGIALAVILLGALAFIVFALPMFTQAQAPAYHEPGSGRGMMGGGRGMMGGGTGQPGGLAPVNPTNSASTPVAPQAAATPQAPAPAASANVATQKAGTWNVTLAMTPYPPVSFQTTTFDITLTDEKGAALTDAQVSLDLTMPSMWMPSNKPQAQAVGGGKYQATGKFTMRGAWQIAVIIQRGSEKQTAFFQLGL